MVGTQFVGVPSTMEHENETKVPNLEDIKWSKIKFYYSKHSQSSVVTHTWLAQQHFPRMGNFFVGKPTPMNLLTHSKDDFHHYRGNAATQRSNSAEILDWFSRLFNTSTEFWSLQCVGNLILIVCLCLNFWYGERHGAC